MKNNQHQPGYIQLTAQGDMPVTLEEVVPLLTTPGNMLITGFLKSSLEVCRSGILLAEKSGAYCDGWFSHAERVFLSSWQREAWANCTWGEVRERADFILCWKAEEPSGLSCFSEVINAVSPAALWQICSSETRRSKLGLNQFT